MAVWSPPLQDGSEGSSFISRTAWRSRTFLTQHHLFRDPFRHDQAEHFDKQPDKVRMAVLVRQVHHRPRSPQAANEKPPLAAGVCACAAVGSAPPKADTAAMPETSARRSMPATVQFLVIGFSRSVI